MLKLGRKILSFRKRIVAIVVGVTMVTLSLLFTNDMARRLREKEQHEVALWVHAMERVMSDSSNDPFVQDILSQRNNIPFIITNQNLKVLHSHLIPEEIINHPDRLRKKINQLTEENTPITIQYYWGKDHKHIIFFGQSRLLKTLYWFPYIQLSVIAIFILLGFIAFRSTKQDEQNRVWIGLAKETAHQLGTPHLLAAGMDRIPAHAARRSGCRRRDEQGLEPPDEDRGPLLENRFRNSAHPREYQRNSKRIGDVFPHAGTPQRSDRL